MGKAKGACQNGGDGKPSAEEKESIVENNRLKELAFSRGLLSRSKAKSADALRPLKAIRKCDGKDIVKKGHRKSKYLFSFPGLVAPVSGGKFGELTRLDSRNPILYIDFPRGRLKLFGTIVYPRNKYLTMQFHPGRGNIVCEDCFESIVVFPEAWWIGTKDENPGELRLEIPSNLQQEKHSNFDFNGGAGRAPDQNASAEERAAPNEKDEPASPSAQFRVGGFLGSQSMDDLHVEEKITPIRQSSRTAGKKFNYADLSPNGSDAGSDEDSESSNFKRKGKRHGYQIGSVSKHEQMQEKASMGFKGSSKGSEHVDKDHSEKRVVDVFGKSSAHQKKTLGAIFEKYSEPKLPDTNTGKGGLKQSTLKSFLAKPSEADEDELSLSEDHSNSTEDISRSPDSQKPSKRRKKNASNRGSKKKVQVRAPLSEESDDEELDQDYGQSSSDSGVKVQRKQVRVPLKTRMVPASKGQQRGTKRTTSTRKKRSLGKITHDSDTSSYSPGEG